MKNAKIVSIKRSPNGLGRAVVTVEIDASWSEVGTLIQQNSDGYITVRGKEDE